VPDGEIPSVTQTVLDPEHATWPEAHAPGEHDAGAMSSVMPLQSSSTPLQVSTEGVPGSPLHIVPSVSETTATGVVRCMVVPSPRLPALLPQQRNERSLSNAHVE
jgi:hypothetical protein